MTVAAVHRNWDIFISYARDNAAWVKESLYEPLLRCRTEAGGRPVVFLDTAKEGIPSAANFFEYIAEAMQRSRYVVAIYSWAYFHSDMCDYELKLALGLHVKRKAELHPVFLEPTAEAQVPLYVSQINWYSADRQDWFERLCEDLRLTTARTPPSLRFRGEIGDVTVNHTLPAVEVAVVDSETGAVVASGDVLTIRSVGGDVQGTLAVAVDGGTAAFRDLSFTSPAPEVTLLVEAPGLEPVESARFQVKPEASVPASRQSATIRARGLPVFFPDCQTLAVLGETRLSVFAAVLPHEREEQETAYPVIERILKHEDPTGPLIQTHHEIHRLTRLFGRLVAHLPPEGPAREDCRDLRRVLYGLHAILCLHFAQEEELYSLFET